MSVGYTQKQAERLKHRIDLQMAKVEDDIAALGHIVTDSGLGTLFGVMQIEELREMAAELKAAVDRRTRG